MSVALYRVVAALIGTALGLITVLVFKDVLPGSWPVLAALLVACVLANLMSTQWPHLNYISVAARHRRGERGCGHPGGAGARARHPDRLGGGRRRLLRGLAGDGAGPRSAQHRLRDRRLPAPRGGLLSAACAGRRRKGEHAHDRRRLSPASHDGPPSRRRRAVQEAPLASGRGLDETLVAIEAAVARHDRPSTAQRGGGGEEGARRACTRPI